MTKNLFIIFGLVLILPLLCSCNNNSNSELSDGAVDFANIETTESCSNKYEVIDIDNAENLTESEFYSTYVEDIQITQISDYRPMKPISRVCLDNKNIYALSDDKVYVFDKKTGEYQYCIDYKGHGHKEYISISDIQVIPQKKELLCLSDTQRKLFRISTENGKVKNVENILAGAPFILEVGDYTYYQFAYGTGLNKKETWLLMKSDSTHFIKKAVEIQPIQKMNYLAKGMYLHNNILTFVPVYSDTIYHVNTNEDKIKPVYVIQDKQSLWKQHKTEFNPGEIYEYAIKNGKNYLEADHFFETKNCILFTMVSNDAQRGYPILKEYLYCKNKHKTYFLDVNSYPNIPVAAPFPTMVASDNNHFFGLLTNVEMLKDYEQYNMITNQKLSDIAKNSQEGDNPIFITLKLK